MLGKALVAPGRAIERIGEPRQLPAGQPGREHHVGRVVDAERRDLRQLPGHAPAPHQLARAHVGRLGARRESHPVMLFHHQAAAALHAQFDRQRESHGTRSDHQHIGFQQRLARHPVSLHGFLN